MDGYKVFDAVAKLYTCSYSDAIFNCFHNCVYGCSSDCVYYAGGCSVDCLCVSAIDVVVYFANNIGLQLKVCDGQNLTATELFEDVMEEQDYPHEARQLFSLWLVSDLLGAFLIILHKHTS